MVITRLIGGLGNQMFQYAVGRAISIRNSVQLKLDLTGFDNYTLRPYRLNFFNIDENIATLGDIKQFEPNRMNYKLWLIYKIKQQFYPFHQKPFIVERSYHFDQAILKVKDNAYLSGYWQSEQYFTEIAEVINRDFTLKNDLDGKNKIIKEEIDKSNSVSLHIRRGDFVSNPTTNITHGVLPLDYYYSAIEYIEYNTKKPIFYVFSDDIPWAQKNLTMVKPVKFIDHNGVNADYVDLELLRSCKHHIIANSSFSWWGAWLSTYPDKIVIAPKQWFTEHIMIKRGKMDIIPIGWIKL